MRIKVRKLTIPEGGRLCSACGGHGKVAPAQRQKVRGRVRLGYTPKGAVTCPTCTGKGWV